MTAQQMNVRVGVDGNIVIPVGLSEAGRLIHVRLEPESTRPEGMKQPVSGKDAPDNSVVLNGKQLSAEQSHLLAVLDEVAGAWSDIDYDDPEDSPPDAIEPLS